MFISEEWVADGYTNLMKMLCDVYNVLTRYNYIDTPHWRDT